TEMPRDRLCSFSCSPEVARPDCAWHYVCHALDDGGKLFLPRYAQARVQVTAETSMKIRLGMTQKSNLDRRVTSEGVTRLPVCYRSQEHTSELQSRFDLVCRL